MRLPSFLRSIHFRLSVLYSAVVFGLGGLALAVVFFLIRNHLEKQTMTQYVLSGEPVSSGGVTLIVPQVTEQQVRSLESLFDELVVNELARMMVFVLLGLFLLSIAVGWFVAGRSLRPVGRITRVAAEIQATDLSRRIGLLGPDDELRRLAGTFDAMLDRLDAAFQSQRRFLAQTSHDLRNPLAIIRSNVDVSLADPGADVEEWQATGEIVSRAADRMAGMIDGLLAAARLEVGAVVKVAVNLGDLVADVAGEVRARAEQAGVTVEVEPASVVVEGDRAALTRALGNLVDNALKVSSRGSAILLRCGRKDAAAYLSVADHGPGIAPEVVAGEVRGGSTGLGLGIVREIARSHEGRLEASANEGGGSILTLWIPLTGEEEE